MAFIATPCKQEIDHRQSAGVDRDAGSEAVPKMAEVNIVASECDLCLVDAEEKTDRNFTEALLICAIDEQQVGSAEAVVRIAGQDGLAVDVGSADGGVEIKGHHTASAGNGLLNQESRRE